ncbi:MAG: hypothetical protein HC764_18815 [Pleurocapsa sp. CRU_1_2]|nr:hypothetical protein [Pleurocapsa sp. CRU_1_2]
MLKPCCCRSVVKKRSPDQILRWKRDRSAKIIECKECGVVKIQTKRSNSWRELPDTDRLSSTVLASNFTGNSI